jgi:hypothetical protein
VVAFVHSPAGQRLRTNNHVERTNRKLRYLEKVRYKWRRRTIVRLLVLALDRWRRQLPGGDTAGAQALGVTAGAENSVGRDRPAA